MRRVSVVPAGVLALSLTASPAFGQVAPAPPEIEQARPRWHWDFGATGETVFEHTRASLRDPHFGARLYRDDQVPGTLHDVPDPTAPDADARAAAPDGKHVFWDIALGERMPVFSLYQVNPKRSRYARGLQVYLDAALFGLIDFDSQSTGVIDTDFRVGGSVDVRPPIAGFDLLSLSTGVMHSSTHLGDEYVLSAGTIQAGAVPVANPALPYRANPSFDAVVATLSLDLPFDDRLSARAYGGASKYFTTELPNGDLPSEWRVGGELRWTMSAEYADVLGQRYARSPSAAERTLGDVLEKSKGAPNGAQRVAPEGTYVRKRRGPFGVELAYELMASRRYEHVGATRTATFVGVSGWFYVQHAVLLGVYNLDTVRSSSNALALSIDWMRGRSPFGQLVEYARVDAFALGLQYYW